MNLFQPIGIAASAWRGVATLIPRGRIWLPFLALACVQMAFVLLLVAYHLPALLPLGLPLVRLLGGENATHYPLTYFLLPTMFARLDMAINVIVGSIVGGWATLLFARAYGVGSEGAGLGQALRRAPVLIIVSIPAMALLLGVGELMKLFPRDLVLGDPAVRWGVRAVMLLAVIIIQSLFAYTAAWVVLMGHGIWPAIRDSVRVALRTFLPTFLVVGIPMVLLYPFQYAWMRMDILATKFRPELVLGILVVQLLVQVPATFFIVGGITRLFVWRLRPAEG